MDLWTLKYWSGIENNPCSSITQKNYFCPITFPFHIGMCLVISCPLTLHAVLDISYSCTERQCSCCVCKWNCKHVFGCNFKSHSFKSDGSNLHSERRKYWFPYSEALWRIISPIYQNCVIECIACAILGKLSPCVLAQDLYKHKSISFWQNLSKARVKLHSKREQINQRTNSKMMSLHFDL